jgi:AraC-like DNA-binding protein
LHYTALAAGALAYWRYMEHHGIEPGPLFERVGLDPAAQMDQQDRYPEVGYYRLVKAVVGASGDRLLGLHLVAFWHPSMAHALGYAWLASGTLGEALDRAARFFRITTDRDLLLLEKHDEHIEVILHNPDPSVPTAEEDTDAFFGIFLHLCRAIAGDAFNPLRLSMQRARPPDTAPYEAYFRAPIRYGANRNAIALRAAGLDDPLPTANADMARASDRIIVDYLERHAGANTSLLVRSRLTEQLPSGRATQQSVARALHLSTRTLQRRLGEEGTNFRALLEETRRDLAMQYLRASDLSMNEITYLLGFSEPANFTRAFRRWTGVTPSRFRAGG